RDLELEGGRRACGRRLGSRRGGGRRLLHGGGRGRAGRVTGEDPALQERVQRVGGVQDELRLRPRELAEGVEARLDRVGDGDHRAAALLAERYRPEPARLLDRQQRVRHRIDGQTVALAELEAVVVL